MLPVSTIDSSGILSRAKSAPVAHSINQLGHIAMPKAPPVPTAKINISDSVTGILGNKVYRNRSEVASDDAATEQSARDEANKSGGGKIICRRWHELGFMDDEKARLDQLYGSWLLKHDKACMRGYLTYAPYVVKMMRTDTWQGRLFLKVIGPLVDPWATEMAFRMGGDYKHSVFGSILMEILVVMFRTLDNIRMMNIKRKAHA